MLCFAQPCHHSRICFINEIIRIIPHMLFTIEGKRFPKGVAKATLTSLQWLSKSLLSHSLFLFYLKIYTYVPMLCNLQHENSFMKKSQSIVESKEAKYTLAFSRELSLYNGVWLYICLASKSCWLLRSSVLYIEPLLYVYLRYDMISFSPI